MRDTLLGSWCFSKRGSPVGRTPPPRPSAAVGEAGRGSANPPDLRRHHPASAGSPSPPPPQPRTAAGEEPEICRSDSHPVDR
jgi:hypothetical protein